MKNRTFIIVALMFFISGVIACKFLAKDRITWLFTKYSLQYSEQKLGALALGTEKQRVRDMLGNPFEEGRKNLLQIGSNTYIYCDAYSKPRWAIKNPTLRLFTPVRQVEICFDLEQRLIEIHDNIF